MTENNDKNKILDEVLNDIKLNPTSIRDIYDNSIDFKYDEKPLMVNQYTINRHMVNHIRHKYTNYEGTLKYVNRINDKNDTQYLLYKNAILEQIATQYPYLRKECERQKVYLNMVHLINKG